MIVEITAAFGTSADRRLAGVSRPSTSLTHVDSEEVTDEKDPDVDTVQFGASPDRIRLPFDVRIDADAP